MKATELRIGNWVKQNEKAVSTSHYPGDEFTWDIDDFYNTVLHKPSMVAYEPIPLTEEWLLKFGFEKKISELGIYKEVKLFHSKWLSWDWGDGFYLEDWELEVTAEIKCKYVHQLQNLYFALTGEELIIKP